MATHLTHFGQQDRCGTCRDSLSGNQGNLREPTAKQGNREEVVNTQLALLISRLEVAANAEMIQIHGKHRLGVLLQLRGLRVVIEGKFRDTPNAKGIVLEDARKRVRTGIAHIAAATVYPDKLRTAPTTGILNALAEASLSFRIVTETFESERWIEGTSGSLMECLCHAQVSLAKDDIVEKTARSLSAHLERTARLWAGQAGSCDCLSRLLGIGISKKESASAAADRRETAAKISTLVLANALIFQEQLALSDERVDTLRKLKKSKEIVNTTSEHWRWIWKNINYVPIFQLGEQILDQLPASDSTEETMKMLMEEAQDICKKQAALRHDLMGRIYHKLLQDAKYLGTYYTSVSAATLLLKIGAELEWEIDFGSPSQLKNFRVGDLACGTGTLLMAAVQAIMDLFVKVLAGRERDFRTNDLTVLYSTLMQNVIHGYDILPSAVHLTTSTLALLAPEIAFRSMNLFVMPVGIDHGQARLGSLDFLSSDNIRTQFALDDTQLDSVQTGAASRILANARVPKLDLCVMNPPFVSSRYGNRLFGSLPEDRPELQKALSLLARKTGTSATAGLGALFVPLADKHTKPGGRIAFVLPIAVASGEAWSKVRQFIAERYHLEIVITSHDTERMNFSENTDLSELLFIARKLKTGEVPGNTAYITLRRNPATIHEALDLESRLLNAYRQIAKRKVLQGSLAIQSDDGLVGEITSLPAPKGSHNWTSAIFSQSLLAQVYWNLDQNCCLVNPGMSERNDLPLCRLDVLGGVGYDVRDIMDAFEVDRTATRWTPHPGFWNHNAKQVVQIAQTSNAFLIRRSSPAKGRPLKNFAAVWEKAGRILLVSRLRSNTHRVLAIGLEKKVLGNTWWAFDDSSLSEAQRRALLLWLNSTLGLLMYFGRRAITQGAWMQMKKPAWQSMPVLDVRALDEAQLQALAETYEAIAEESLLPLAQTDSDPVRHRIDQALCEAMSLPDLTLVREVLVKEPSLTERR